MTNPSNNRLARLRHATRAAGLDAFYVQSTTNIQWLTGFENVFDSEQAHALMVTPTSAVLHTDSRYITACEREATRSEEPFPITLNADRCKHGKIARKLWEHDCAPHTDPSEAFRGQLGIEDSMTLADYNSLLECFGLGKDASAADWQQAAGDAPGFAQTTNFIFNLRAVKDSDEVARLKAAQAITDAGFAHIISFIRPGMTEREVQLELDNFMLTHGAEALAFSTIVATGANGASPHAIPGETRMEAGQCVVMDFGAKAAGYCSDMTRTVFLGEPDSDMLRAWETMRRANEEVETLIKPGVTGVDMHRHAEDVLAEGGFEGKMGHGLGHGVGLDIHEEPCLNLRNHNPLEVGNVVTVEPGIYLPGRFGMRLEDFGIVTETGFDVFTQSTHDLVVL